MMVGQATQFLTSGMSKVIKESAPQPSPNNTQAEATGSPGEALDHFQPTPEKTPGTPQDNVNKLLDGGFGLLKNWAQLQKDVSSGVVSLLPGESEVEKGGLKIIDGASDVVQAGIDGAQRGANWTVNRVSWAFSEAGKWLRGK